MNKRYAMTGAIALSALIAGCGGSSGDDDSTPAPAPAPQLGCSEITTEALGLEGLVDASAAAAAVWVIKSLTAPPPRCAAR